MLQSRKSLQHTSLLYTRLQHQSQHQRLQLLQNKRIHHQNNSHLTDHQQNLKHPLSLQSITLQNIMPLRSQHITLQRNQSTRPPKNHLSMPQRNQRHTTLLKSRRTRHLLPRSQPIIHHHRRSRYIANQSLRSPSIDHSHHRSPSRITKLQPTAHRKNKHPSTFLHQKHTTSHQSSSTKE